MKRSDIQIIIRKASITILTAENQLTFSCCADVISVFSTADLSMKMLDELESSKIVEVESYTNNGGCRLVLNVKFGYTSEKLTDILLDLVEKHNL
ncbi:MAG: hypothetical protein VB046_08175 [Paludibacter sp.]|nr:hypothetical protein [Paludibacter sp.]